MVSATLLDRTEARDMITNSTQCGTFAETTSRLDVMATPNCGCHTGNDQFTTKFKSGRFIMHRNDLTKPDKDPRGQLGEWDCVKQPPDQHVCDDVNDGDSPFFQS